MIEFIFSKIVQSFLLPPGIFILLIIIFRKNKKILILISILIGLLSSNFIAYKFLEPLEDNYRQKSNEKFDLVVVLGGGYIYNSPNLGLSSSSFKRLIYALEIAKEQNIPIIFDGYKYEANLTKEVVLNLSKKFNMPIPILKGKYKKEFGIYLQNNALTTIDNAKNVKKFIEKNNITNLKLALVTSAFHMKRALYEFNRVGLKPTPMATDFKINYDDRFLYYLPSSAGLNLTTIALHEYLGLFRNYLFR